MDVQKRKQLWSEFLDLDSDVDRMVLIYCAQRSLKHQVDYREATVAQCTDWTLENFARQTETAELIPDHSIPHVKALGGTEIFAEAFGCRTRRMGSAQSPFAEPLVFSARQADGLRAPHLQDTKLMRILEIAQKARDSIGGNPLVCLPDIQSPAGIAAMVWEKSDFFATMIEEPEIVHVFIEKVKGLLIDFLSLWKRTFGDETIAHYPAYYMPHGITLSEDEIGSVGDNLFHEFFEPSLIELSNRFGASGIHCCANSRHQWENLKKIPNLKLINLHRDTAQTMESLECFRGVCAQMPADGEADVGAIADRKGLHVARFAYVDTVEQARRAVDRFMSR